MPANTITRVFIDDSQTDAFGRLPVASPQYTFDAQFTYDIHPLLFEQFATASSGSSTVAHDSTERCARMTFAAAVNGESAIQSFEHFRYQPGRALLVLASFNFLGPATGVRKYVLYGNTTNGIGLELNGNVPRFVIYNGGSALGQTAESSQWNLDKMDGTGTSKIKLDWTKTQILVLDLQALYVGRVRCGFHINGVLYWAHEFLNANVLAAPYIQSANQPIRAGMTSGAAASTSMLFICCSVTSGDSEPDMGGYSFAADGTQPTVPSGSYAHVLSVRPRTTFNSITNRAKFDLENVDLLVTGASGVQWALAVGSTFSGSPTFGNVDGTYSTMEATTGPGTLSGNGTIIASGYCPAATSKQAILKSLWMRAPITLDAAGVQHALGTLSLLAKGIGGTSAVSAALNWREIR